MYLSDRGIKKDEIRDSMVTSVVKEAEGIYKRCVMVEGSVYKERDRRLDKIFTSKSTGIPIMLLLLGIIFWITIVGANYPSVLLSNLLFGFVDFFAKLGNKIFMERFFTFFSSNARFFF